MAVQLLDLTLASAAADLALDEALLHAAEEQQLGETLRLWEPLGPVVVLGVSGRVRDDVHVEACAADAVPVLRRASGGGTVLLGPGSLCFTLVLDMEQRPELRAVRSSYAAILGTISAALAAPGLRTEMCGSSDLACDARKVSGNAQKRGRRYLLHHGTLLYAFEIERVERYLRQPNRQPDYRRDRPHAEFVVNLPLPADLLRRRLVEAWQATVAVAHPPLAHAETLLAERYLRPEWNLRR